MKSEQLEQLFHIKEMLNAFGFTPAVVLQKGMMPLARQHADVVRVVVFPVAILVVDDLTRSELAPQLPLCHRPVFVEGLPCFRVPAADVGIVGSICHK